MNQRTRTGRLVSELPEITNGQRWWLERIWKAFGTPLEVMDYGVGAHGAARMAINGLVFCVDRETNAVSVESGLSARWPDSVREHMIWREEHGYDGSYEATVDFLAGDS